MAGFDITMLKHMIDIEALKKDAGSRNFSIYGKWLGIVSVLLGLAVGIANLIRLDIIIVWSILALCQSVSVLMTEAQFLLKICPFNDNYAGLMARVNNNWTRTAFYLLNALIQWLTLIFKPTSLIALAAVWTVCGIFYGLAAFAHQDFHGSNSTGGLAAASDIPPSAIRQIL